MKPIEMNCNGKKKKFLNLHSTISIGNKYVSQTTGVTSQNVVLLMVAEVWPVIPPKFVCLHHVSK